MELIEKPQSTADVMHNQRVNRLLNAAGKRIQERRAAQARRRDEEAQLKAAEKDAAAAEALWLRMEKEGKVD